MRLLSFQPRFGLLVVLILTGFVMPHTAVGGVPEEETCPEGLVYDAAGDICVLPENLPADDGAAGEEAGADNGEGDPAGDGQQPAAAADGAIRNLTLLPFACPVNWDPATRPIESSREMCSGGVTPEVTYTVLFEGTFLIEVGLGQDIDLDQEIRVDNGVPLPAGMYTIRESPAEGQADPFAFCAIYAADGTSRLTVMETIPGGTLDILLAADEEVNCEWYSVAAVPEVTGDPNALPIEGLRLDGFFCPFGVDKAQGEAYLIDVCTEGGLNGFEFTASLNGVVVSTQPGPAGASTVDFQNGLDSRLLSGTWTLGVTPAPGYGESYVYCSITSAEGAVRAVPETPLAVLALELQPGELGHCNLFNVEAEPRSGTSLGIQVKLFTCPPPAEFSGGLEDCTLPLAGPVSLEFISRGQVMETGTVSPPETTYTVRAGDSRPLSGEWTIRPILPEGWIDPHFTCNSVDSSGVRGNVAYAPPADGSVGVTAKFGPNVRLECAMWLFTGDVRESVVVVTRYCPDDVDVASMVAADLKVTCGTTQFRPVSYTVDGGTPVQGESTRNGLAVFPAQPGQWRITVDPGEGRVAGFVTCDHTLAALAQVQTIEPAINTDRMSITIDLEEGDALRCEFFSGVGATGALELPAAGEETGAGAEDPGSDEIGADTPGSGVGDPAGEEAGTGDGAPEPAGEAPAGPEETGNGAAEAAPGTTGPGTSGAFGGGSQGTAGGTGTDGPPAQPDGAPAAPEGAPAPAGVNEGGTALGAATSELSIQHYDCDGPVAGATVDDLVANCTPSLAPSSWDMNGNPLEIGDGYAVWAGLEPGTIRVSNLAAGGQDDAASAVYCSIAPAGSVPLVGLQVPVRDGAIEIVFDQPAVVYCAWFLAP